MAHFLYVTTKLIYVDDELPGITRKGAGRGFAYYTPEGQLIRDRKERRRLNGIALPPAYREAWFCPLPNGHILATGYDEKRRKQYRYHPEFRILQEAKKFDACAAFGKALPRLRKRVEADLEDDGHSHDRIVASVVRLLDLGKIRVGNEYYSVTNQSFGATTLKHRHVEVERDEIRLHFKGKGGKQRDVTFGDAALADVIEQLQELPGQRLFQYEGADGELHPVESCDVNDYLQDVMGEGFTAKDFRTWHASAMAFEIIAQASERLTIASVTEYVADRLGNTAAIARKSYIHPAVIGLIDDEDARAELQAMLRASTWLSRAERGLLSYLEEAPPAKELLAA